MLLPSALSCDSAQPSRPALQSSFFSPPASPPTLHHSATALGNIVTTCRSLQSLIATTPASASALPLAPPQSSAQLPTPPMAHAALPMKLRLRTRPARSDAKNNDGEDPDSRRKVVKRPAPPRGVNKRRRGGGDDVGGEDLSSEEEDADSDAEPARPRPRADDQAEEEAAAPATPKRSRIAPERLPLGLARSDFHDIDRLGGGSESTTGNGTAVEVEADGEQWSAEDDRVLVELVLEKLKLSKSEWHDCARNLGKDRHSVNRRWRSLIMKGDVGLKTRSSSRRRLHSTWR
ncbi:MYB-like protein [Metarhizium album ARSEF 1941]|uniref:MYB-like protein n=1 Tax=Metarhizium album (strain ARSEF 1941) TaxID=1081103 RepID=A0A0B2WYJ0_METAS|nr:MYB-like protein [Metarhizium album ARSEF 1941]KHN98492.1 MYB-like protein [Metarhizium album ARSEF 1941]